MALDEFPIFLEHLLSSGHSGPIVQRILGQLKNWRQQFPHFRLLLGGSISLDRVLAKNAINGATINDLSRYFLPPLGREQANSFLKELATSYKLDWYGGTEIEETLDLLGDYYPFFLQSFFQEIRTKGGPGGPSLEVILENYFIPAIQHGFFEQFMSRLKNHYSEESQAVARDILDLIVQREEFFRVADYSALRAQHCLSDKSQAVNLDDLLYDLVSDEFLSFNSRTQEYSFATSLVCQWWRLSRGRKR